MSRPRYVACSSESAFIFASSNDREALDKQISVFIDNNKTDVHIYKYDRVSAYPSNLIRPSHWKHRLTLFSALLAVGVITAPLYRWAGNGWTYSLVMGCASSFCGSATYQILSYFERRRFRKWIGTGGNVYGGRP